MMENYIEKLKELMNVEKNKPVEFSQRNKELGDGYTECEVTFVYKTKTPIKK
ncbi:hypothetical protein CU019_1661 [Enterococcus faecium]|nr:hypothetical protein [Enterococcus faecium]MBK4788776.1 hypothetical protein [Enterococcus faecium]MBK4790579.1 hypothetical protein [Enterococcus faecium]MBK4798860.1 hypothetical protein [Enterococcus faecium]MBK4820287.1 hypothetical protein [Enterococcus faecium]